MPYPTATGIVATAKLLFSIGNLSKSRPSRWMLHQRWSIRHRRYRREGGLKRERRRRTLRFVQRDPWMEAVLSKLPLRSPLMSRRRREHQEKRLGGNFRGGQKIKWGGGKKAQLTSNNEKISWRLDMER